MLDHRIEQRVLPAQVARSNRLALRFDHLDHQIGLGGSCAKLHRNPPAVAVTNASPLRAVQQRINVHSIIWMEELREGCSVRHRHVDQPAEGAARAEHPSSTVDGEQQVALALRDPPPPGCIEFGHSKVRCCR